MDSNFRDDFTLLLGLLDAQGSPIDWPDADFCGELSTRGLQRFAFGRAGGVLTNCRPASLDECGENAAAGMLLVSAKAHGLPPGQVKASVTFALPDPDMPGGFRSVTVKWPSDRGAAPEPVRLTTGPSSPDGSSLATVLMPTPLVVRTAYQLAVAEGYEGTAEDYMAALTALPEAVAEAQAVPGRVEAQSAEAVAGAIAELRAEPFAYRDRNNNFTAAQTVNGTLTVNGDLVQLGETYEVEAEHVRSKNAYVTVRDGAVGGLGADERSGIEVKNYDGEHDGAIEIGPDGVLRVGDKGDTQPLLTRAEAAELHDGDLLVWRESEQRAVPLRKKIVEMEVTYDDDTTAKFNVICEDDEG